jgi:hypothetical protein
MEPSPKPVQAVGALICSSGFHKKSSDFVGTFFGFRFRGMNAAQNKNAPRLGFSCRGRARFDALERVVMDITLIRRMHRMSQCDSGWRNKKRPGEPGRL